MDHDPSSVGASGGHTLGTLAGFDRRPGRLILSSVLIGIHQLTPEWPRDAVDARRIAARLTCDAWAIHVLSGGDDSDLDAASDHILERQRSTSAGWPTVAERGAREHAEHPSSGRGTDPHREPGPTALCPYCGAASPAGYIVHRHGCSELARPNVDPGAGPDADG